MTDAKKVFEISRAYDPKVYDPEAVAAASPPDTPRPQYDPEGDKP